MKSHALAAAALALATAACAHSGPPPLEEPVTGEVEVHGPPPAPRPPGLLRPELLSVLDEGPASFLRGIRVRATNGENGFIGWEILSFFPGDARFAGVDLAPGDIVVSVNGSSMERPEQFSEVWEGLRKAPALVVEVKRGSTVRELRYPIVE